MAALQHQTRKPPAAETARVLKAISTCQATFASKIEEVKVDISCIRKDFHKLWDRVTEAETHIGRMEN